MLAGRSFSGRRWISVAMLAAVWLPLASAQTSAQHALLERYCFSCHSEKLKTGGGAAPAVGPRHNRAGATRGGKKARQGYTRRNPPPPKAPPGASPPGS